MTKSTRGVPKGTKRTPYNTPKIPTTTINFRIPTSDKVELKKFPISKLFKEWYKELLKKQLL